MDAPPLELVLDQGLPREAAEHMRAAGFACTHVGEIGMHAAEDTDILAWALHRDSVVVTLDADFHAILAVTKARKPSVIRVRIQGLNGPMLARLLQGVVSTYRSQINSGCLLTVKRLKTTCHRLDRE